MAGGWKSQWQIANCQLLCPQAAGAESKGVEVGVVDGHLTRLTFMQGTGTHLMSQTSN